MALVNFISMRREVTLLFFHHNTETSENAGKFLGDFSNKNNLKLHSEKLSVEKPKKVSPEEFWRIERYKFFDKFKDKPILMAHHLDDCVETYLMSSFHGCPKLIPHNTGNFYRPFLMTPKKILIDWCVRKNVPWQEDLSNKDNSFARNRIRNIILPEVKKINPGIDKVIKKKLYNLYKASNAPIS